MTAPPVSMAAACRDLDALAQENRDLRAALKVALHQLVAWKTRHDNTLRWGGDD